MRVYIDRRLFLLVIPIFYASAVMAQNEGEKQALREMSNIKASEWKSGRLAAEAEAEQRGIPVFIQTETGGMELQFFRSNGIPAYYRTFNLNAAHTISTSKVLPGGSYGLSLTGSGLPVHIWDIGKPRLTHQELTGRVAVLDEASNIITHFHTTHCAGTLIASGVNSNARGMAPQGQLKSFDWNSDLSEMYQQAAAGALISSHSYGFVQGWNWSGSQWIWYGDPSISATEDYLFGFYDHYTASLDQLATMAPFYLICKAAGNDRGEGPGNYPPDDGPYDCIASDAVAKNILTVGAVMDLPSGYVNAPGVQMTSFSSWGPTDDGRIKPDICANGQDVFSADSDHDADYLVLTGTSMATPSVAGSALLLQEYYNDLHHSFMKASTLKALIIHTADEAGPSDGPDYMFGWGLMNTAKAIDKISEDTVINAIDELELYNGSTYTRTLAASGNVPLTITIVWADPPGTPVAPIVDPTSPMLVNDLDLKVVDASGNVYYPWKLNPLQPTSAATRSGKNSADNVEQVFIATPPPGFYTIIVSHDGPLSGSYQDFSIIISGEDVIVEKPLIFNATVCGTTDGSVTLNWTRANPDDKVLLAWNSEHRFGDPVQGYHYKEGGHLSGGGMVLCHGDLDSCVHSGLASGAEYFYQLWTVDSLDRYSGAKSISIITSGDYYESPKELSIKNEGCGVAGLSWASPEVTLPYIDEDFESFSDFSLSMPLWTQVDVDGSITYGISGVTFPNQYYQGSFMVFNPSMTNPADPAGFTTHSGNKMAACFSAANTINNDWLISPRVLIDSGFALKFYARSVTSAYGLERFTVNVSSSGKNPADFSIISAGTYIQAPVSWTEYSYDLSAWAGQELYIAIHAVSDHAFALLLDDFFVGPSNSSKSAPKGSVQPPLAAGYKPLSVTRSDPGNNLYLPGKPFFPKGQESGILAGYAIFRDGQFLDTISSPFQTTYIDSSAGFYPRTYYVTALYDNPKAMSGPSSMESINLARFPSYSSSVSESFESTGLPAGWIQYKVTGSNSWQITTMRKNSGARSIFFDDFMSASDVWLISPPIAINPGEDVLLNYYENIFFPTWAEEHNVLVSSDYPGVGNPESYSWTTLNSAIGTENVWKKKSFNISSYGSVVYIAFQYKGTFASEWYIDDVTFEATGNCYLTWDGSENSDWFDPDNWSNGIVPGKYDDVVIPGGLPNYPDTFSAGLAEAGMLQIDNMARFSLPADASLDVWGPLVIEGHLMVNIEAEDAGSVIAHDGIYGNGGASLIIAYNASEPVHVSPAFPNTNAALFNGMTLEVFNEGDGKWDTLYTQDGDLLEMMKGYILRDLLPSKQIIMTGTPFHATDYSTILPNSALAPFHTRGFNLTGNPYPAWIDWEDQSNIIRSNIDAALYTWDPTLNNGRGNYSVYINGHRINNGSSYIRPGQSFFVRVEDASQASALVVKEGARMHQPMEAFTVTSYAPDEKMILLALGSGDMSDETGVLFSATGTAGYDPQHDALKLMAADPDIPQLFSADASGRYYAFNSYGPLEDTVTVPLDAIGSIPGPLEITLSSVVNLAEGTLLLLHDLATDSVHTLTQGSSYVFSDISHSYPTRFLLKVIAMKLHGSITYNNSSNTPLGGSDIILSGSQGNDTISLNALSDGSFSSTNVFNDEYALSASVYHAAGGINASDAYAIAMHFIGASYLTGLSFRASDVDDNGYVNMMDAYTVQQYFVGYINAFPAGEWLHDPDQHIQSGQNTATLDVKAQCVGDANASYVPVQKTGPGISLSGKGKAGKLMADSMLMVPFTSASNITVCAVSLILGLSGNDFELVDLAMYGGGELVYRIDGNMLYVAWYSMEPFQLMADDTLFCLLLRPGPGGQKQHWNFTVYEGSEMADQEGQKISDAVLLYPDQFFSPPPSLSFSIFPNPVSENAILRVVVPQPGHFEAGLYDVTGREVLTLCNGRLEEGIHQIRFSCNALPAGWYNAVLRFQGIPVRTEGVIVTQPQR